MLKEFIVPNLTVRFAKSEMERQAAQRLRYQVFVGELQASAKEADHLRAIEKDRFDQYALHLCVFDQNLQETDPINAVMATVRLYNPKMSNNQAGFYSENEFDLTMVHKLSQNILELGRFCVHPKLRNGAGIAMLWKGLAEYIEASAIDYLIGTASYHGTAIDGKAESLSYLAHHYLAPLEMRAMVHLENALDFTPIPAPQINSFCAMRDTPGLIKSYLRLGGLLGEGAYVDHDFNTIDLFVILPTNRLNKLKNLP